MAQNGEIDYVVRKGDSIPDISGKFVMEALGRPSTTAGWGERLKLRAVEEQAIRDRNGLPAKSTEGGSADPNPDRLIPGQHLIIPDPKALYARMQTNTPR